MPRIGQENGFESHQIGGSNFSFGGARIENLGATEYTLTVTAIDVTGSTAPFASELREMLVTSIKADKASPRSENLLARVTTFSTAVGGVREIHGFKQLSEINPSDYPEMDPHGFTPLYDAVYEAVGSAGEQGRLLAENDFFANAIVFIVTDGMDNESTTTPAMIKEMVRRIREDEHLESILTILIGLNTERCRDFLEAFQREADIDHFIDVGEVTPGKLAKLAGFRSRSVSSQSQALGTGGPSEKISATI